MNFFAWIQRNWFNAYILEFMYIFKIDFKTELQMPGTCEFPWWYTVSDTTEMHFYPFYESVFWISSLFLEPSPS